jgi:hypothetical protein
MFAVDDSQCVHVRVSWQQQVVQVTKEDVYGRREVQQVLHAVAQLSTVAVTIGFKVPEGCVKSRHEGLKKNQTTKK